MLKSILCDYSDAYIPVKGTLTIANTVAAYTDAINTNKKVINKNCVSITNWKSGINNTKIDDAQYIDVVMPIYNLIWYNDNY